MKDYYTLLHNFLEKHFPAQLPKLEAIKDNDVEVIMMYNMYKRSAKNALKERAVSNINEVKEMTFGAYLDDLDNRFVDLMKAAKGLNAEGSQEIDMRATINQNFTLFRNYISALKREYSDELNKELTFSINETKEGGEIWPKEMTYDQAIAENKILKQAKLSSAEYQKAKKLKGFNKEDYEWNPDEGLYVKEKKSKFKKHGEMSGFDMRGITEASKGAMNYFGDLKFNYQKAFRYLDVEEREEYKRLVKDFFSKLQVDNKVRAVGKVNESYDYDEVAQSEFGMDYDQLGSGEQEWVRDEIDNMSINEDVSKHIVKHSKSNNTYQVWLGDEIVTDFATKERADAEAKRLNALQNVNEAKKDIYDKFLENPTSPKGRAKAIISKFKKKYGEDATEMAVDRFSKQNNLKPEEKYILQYITKNKIKITSQPGGPNLSVVNEAKATCCHRCGRVHVKGSGCKKPYLKGKDSCAINEIETLKEFFNK